MSGTRYSTPKQHATHVIDFSRLDGGLNLWDLEYRLDVRQSPEMKNLWWQDGALQCRDGQGYVVAPPGQGRGFAATTSLFWGYAVLHIGTNLYYVNPASESPVLKSFASKVPENRGTFFSYGDYLFYKNQGGFYRITYNPNSVNTPFSVTDMLDAAYVPVILLNADPDTGSGDMYQPENRLTSKKTVRYNAKATSVNVVRTASTDEQTEFSLENDFDEDGVAYDTGHIVGVRTVMVNNTVVASSMYSFDDETKTLKFTKAPGSGASIAIELRIGVDLYQLPDKDISGVTRVAVDGVVLTPAAGEDSEGDYGVDQATGKVAFKTPPPITNPATNNTVEITYYKDNDSSRAAQSSIMDCKYAVVYGAGKDLSILFGGCPAQPNAVFWNSNDNVSMNPGYWPMSYYNLCGDTEDAVTGFGKQYSHLMLFKKKSVGKLNYTVETVDGRSSISYTHESVNNKIGCDLPWTIQLIENNLVFGNTSGGIFRVQDTSYANENNIVNISLLINGTDARPGLLAAVTNADPDEVCSFDDANRYWICANGETYVWDYLVSGYSKPSWFYLTNIPAVSFFHDYGRSYHLGRDGGLSVFQRDFLDYGEAIEKVYKFAPSFFDTYDRLKDILRVIISVRGDTDSIVDIQYISDYERRYDLTPIRTFSWRLAPRNLLWRCMSPARFATVAIRKPGCRHIRHFSLRLENNQPGQDLSILTAQIFFRLLGRDR